MLSLAELTPAKHKTLAKRMDVVLDARVVSGTGGGPDKTILNSPRFLAPAGYRMVCAYLHPPKDPGFEVLRRKAESRNAPLVSVPDRGPFDWRVVPRLLQICRRENVKIWHGHDYKSNALGLLLNRFWPMRLVTTVHGWVEHTARTPLYYAIDRLSLRFYEKVFCVSQDLYDLVRKAGVPASRCEVLENGIDLDECRRRRGIEEAKTALGFPPGRFLVGAVGRLSAEKGFDVLVQAVDQLLKQGRDVGLVIVGAGNEMTALKRQIAALGRADRISLAGFQSDTIPWYEAMDVFALSSYREGLPNVLLEAMALRVPVIATSVAGVPKLVQHLDNGLLVTPGSAPELAEGITRLQDYPPLREELAQAGRETVETRYSFALRMEKLRRFYDRVMARRSAG